jgi:hypothetical protein
MLFERYLLAEKVESLNDLKELMLLEQYLKVVPADLKMYLLERKPKTLVQASRMSDEYSILHSNIKQANIQLDKSKPYYHNNNSTSKNYNKLPNTSTPTTNRTSSSYRDFKTSPNFSCSYCKIPGHLISECRKRKADLVKHVALVSVQTNSDSQNNIYVHPITFTDNLSGEEIVVSCYRDTGSTITLLKEGVIPDKYLTSLDCKINIQCMVGNCAEVCLYQANIRSKLLSGTITLGIVPDSCVFPKNTVMILGNDNGPEMSVFAVTTRQQAKAKSSDIDTKLPIDT